MGITLSRFSNGIDNRPVNPRIIAKSISTETTFDIDVTGLNDLKPIFWKLCEELSKRMKSKSKSGRVITLKFKTSDFKTFTRRKTLNAPTQLAEMLYQTTSDILRQEAKKQFRLLGISASDLCESEDADDGDFLDLKFNKTKSLEKTIDNIRKKLGNNVIKKGRALNK